MKGLFCLACLCISITANSQVGIGTTTPNTSAQLDISSASKGVLIPRVSLTSASDISTVMTPVISLLIYNTSSAGAFPNNVIPGYYYWNGSKWMTISSRSHMITFSTGTVLNGASVVSNSPILMGFGNHAVETINGAGQSTMPPEAAGFSFTIPFNGTIDNLQVSADAFVSSVVVINNVGIQYDFTLFIAPSNQNNGIDHIASPFMTAPLTSYVRFGFPNTIITPGTFRTSSNITPGSIAVIAGDRIGVRVRTLNSTDASAPDISQLSFNASLMYTPN